MSGYLSPQELARLERGCNPVELREGIGNPEPTSTPSRANTKRPGVPGPTSLPLVILLLGPDERMTTS